MEVFRISQIYNSLRNYFESLSALILTFSENEVEKAIPESKPKQSRVQKSSKRTQRKAPFNPQSQGVKQVLFSLILFYLWQEIAK